jgi:hypothetical protein
MKPEVRDQLDTALAKAIDHIHGMLDKEPGFSEWNIDMIREPMEVPSEDGFYKSFAPGPRYSMTLVIRKGVGNMTDWGARVKHDRDIIEEGNSSPPATGLPAPEPRRERFDPEPFRRPITAESIGKDLHPDGPSLSERLDNVETKLTEVEGHIGDAISILERLMTTIERKS